MKPAVFLCLQCGNPINQSGPGRVKRLCSKTCLNKHDLALKLSSTRCPSCGYEKEVGARRCKNCCSCGSRRKLQEDGTLSCKNRTHHSGGHNIQSATEKRLKRYNLTSKRVKQILEIQSNGCAICSAPLTFETGCVDHNRDCCNRSGSCGHCVRGILCFNCNVAIGLLRDSPELFLAATRYVSQPPAREAFVL